MKEELRVRLVDFLQTAQQIIEGDGKTSFGGCHKRCRQEIVKLFMDSFEYDTDSDNIGCAMYMTEGDTHEAELSFAANCDYCDDLRNEASRMYLGIYTPSGEIETIPEAIEYLGSIRGEGVFKWVFNACIYGKADGTVLYSRLYDTYSEAQSAIEENIGRFADADYPPTGHINKEYVWAD